MQAKNSDESGIRIVLRVVSVTECTLDHSLMVAGVYSQRSVTIGLKSGMPFACMTNKKAYPIELVFSVRML